MYWRFRCQLICARSQFTFTLKPLLDAASGCELASWRGAGMIEAPATADIRFQRPLAVKNVFSARVNFAVIRAKKHVRDVKKWFSDLFYLQEYLVFCESKICSSSMDRKVRWEKENCAGARSLSASRTVLLAGSESTLRCCNGKTDWAENENLIPSINSFWCNERFKLRINSH